MMVLRTLTGVTGGLAAGLVLGAKVPVVMPSPRDPMEVRIASCVLASLAFAAANAARARTRRPRRARRPARPARGSRL